MYLVLAFCDGLVLAFCTCYGRLLSQLWTYVLVVCRVRRPVTLYYSLETGFIKLMTSRSCLPVMFLRKYSKGKER